MECHQAVWKKMWLKLMRRSHEGAKKKVKWEVLYDVDDEIVGDSIIASQELIGVLTEALEEI